MWLSGGQEPPGIDRQIMMGSPLPKNQTEKSQELIKINGIITSSTSQTQAEGNISSLRRTRGSNSMKFDEFLRFVGLKML